ncbi:MAG: hypothetical protein LC797_18270 [Chloroflexi bacterium]|nr:hypothetical protein [Chloroflexota bacterium]
MIWGDVVIHPAQVSEPEWNVMFDMDGETACATRRAVLDRVEADGLTVAARHFPDPGSAAWYASTAAVTGSACRSASDADF